MRLKVFTVMLVGLAVLLGACGKSDADIQKAVTDKMTAEKMTGVTAAVKDGVATLTGEVADITVKTKAETAAKMVDGVKSTVNNLTLKPLPPPPPPPADPMLKGKLEEALKKAGCTGATVETADGKITLKGTVASAKYPECIQIAQQSGGAGLDNQLQKGK